MFLRNSADLRPLLWLTMAVALLMVEYRWSWLVFLFFPLNMYLAVCAGVIAHNHNHCPVFRSRRVNGWLGHVLTFFYGYPTFAWVPTHNLNHHKHVNRAGDATITWRVSDKHDFWTAWSYFFVSSYHQAAPIKAFLSKAKEKNPGLYRRIQWQYGVWLGVWASVWLLGVYLHGPRRGTVLWIFGIGWPALVSVWTIMLFNYEQHVHTDPWSDHNHSRNFTGGVLNFLLFNNGFHGVHHEQPGLHWSKLPAAHEKIADQIDPELCQKNVVWFFIKQFVLARREPHRGTQQVGRAPYSPPDGTAIDQLNLLSDDVELGEAGANTEMAAR